MGYSVLSKYRGELMGAAILWVMLFHASGLELGFPWFEYFRAAGFGGVDIFVFLSSVGLAGSLLRRERDYSSFMARRAGRILPAYYLVMVPYTLFLIFRRGALWSSLFWNATLLAYWIRDPGAFNWYITGAMTFYAITPACFRRLRRSGHREGVTAAAVLACMAVNWLLVKEGYWYVMEVAFRVPVFFLGLLLGFYAAEERRFGWKDLLFWCLSLGVGIVYATLFLLGKTPIFGPAFLFTTVPMCLTACLCFAYLPLGWLRAFLRLLGRHSLEIYLLNVSLFSEAVPLRQFVPFGANNRLYYLLSFAANIALGVLLHRLVEWGKERCRVVRGAA